MYGKIFASMYDGTLRVNWKAMVTLQQMIILANVDGVVDMSPHALHGRTGIPLDIIEEGLTALEAPDPHSRTKEFDGRRIERLDAHRDWGWILLNYQKYRNLASQDEKREADRVRLAEKRKNSIKSDMSQDVAECRNLSHEVANVAHVEEEVEEEVKIYRGAKRATNTPDGFEITDDLKTWGKERGINLGVLENETEKFLDYHRAKGSTFKDWKAAWRKWMRNHKEWNKPKVSEFEGAL